MLLILVITIFIFLTLFHYTKEGMEIMDKSTIVATDTNIQLPNYVSGTRGDDLTFGGNINVEKNDYLEFGKGLPKGDNSGKIRYHGENLEIFGAGKNGDPYKVKLWDDVEVGGLLQVNSALQFGKDQGKIHYDTSAKNLNIMGPGTTGQRKVKIWDDVEVGKLLSTNGIEVRGPFQAYNDMNISGALNARNIKSARISVGDLDISGSINNTELNTRLSQLDQSIQEHGAYIANNPDLITLQTRVTSLTDKINGAPVPADAVLFNQVKSQVDQLVIDASNNTNMFVNKTEYNTGLEKAKTDLKTEILNTMSSSIDAAKSNLKTEILASVSASLNTAKSNADAQLSNMLNTLSKANSDTSTKTMSDASLNIMFAKYDLNLQNISTQANLAMAKAVENAPDQDWMTNKNKLLQWTDLEPAKLNVLANANLDTSKLNALTNANLDTIKLNALTNLDTSKLNALASSNLDFGPNGILANLANSNLNVSKLSSWANASKTYNELQDTLETLSSSMNGYATSSWANETFAKKIDLNTAINGLNASYIPKTDANNYATSSWANETFAKKIDLNTAISGLDDTIRDLDATYIPKTDANNYATSTWANETFAKKIDLTTGISGLNSVISGATSGINNVISSMNASYIPRTEASNYMTSTWANETFAKKIDLTSAISGLDATYIPKTESNSYARFDSNNNLPVPGNLLVGNANKWKLDPLQDSLRVTKQ